ncbi:MAG: RIP metalloprotease RseP [Firmicutes bacterium]|nr:RIP metalloprotease RseP [Bacillota bacterium]
MLGSALMILVAFVFVFLTFALSHEFGHFIVGKACGVRVYEFSLGFGPSIRQFAPGETVYSIRILPLGAFVKFAGLDEPADPADDVDDEDPRSFRSKPVILRILTILAGPFMNFIVAFILFAIVFVQVGVPSAVIEQVYPDTPAWRGGIMAGDRIISIDDTRTDTIADVKDRIWQNPGRQLTFTIERDGVRIERVVTPEIDPGTRGGVIGVMLSETWTRRGFFECVSRGASFTKSLSKNLLLTIGRMVTGKVKPDVAGPIGIAQAVGQTAKLGFINVLYLAALLNVNLGLLNLLPIPVLDGGWIVLLLIEAIRRKPLSVEQEAFARMIGMAILGLLIVFATFSDIARLGALGG